MPDTDEIGQVRIWHDRYVYTLSILTTIRDHASPTFSFRGLYPGYDQGVSALRKPLLLDTCITTQPQVRGLIAKEHAFPAGESAVGLATRYRIGQPLSVYVILAQALPASPLERSRRAARPSKDEHAAGMLGGWMMSWLVLFWKLARM